VEEDRRAWHAGVSAWAGRTGLNDTAIGIEIVNGGHDFGLPPFPAAQVKAVEELVIDILRRRGLGPHRVVGHSDIAPDRKQDPGERFPWRALAEAGAALWPLGSARADRGPAFGPGEAGEAVMAVQEALAGFGYGVDVTGVFDASTEAAMRAFQRRFRPDRIDGRADPECLAILADLLGQLSRLALPRLRS
jgi:N-acetylmuramoyl-L-alanine amidase